MRRRRRPSAALLLLAALILTGCGGSVTDEPTLHEPATVEHPEGSDVARITLSDGAAARLDIQTTPVQRMGDRIVVPSSALLVDPSGVFWVYTSPEPLVFVRRRIDVDREEAGRAFLLNGPAVGTDVVTVGVAELYGAEFEIGH
jgi:hypothetical protein